MSSTIINLIKDQLGSGLISQFANRSGDSETGISKAISAFIPTILGGLAQNSNNSKVVESISNPESISFLNNLMGNSSQNTMITSLLSTLFGDKVGNVVSTIAHYAGINNSTSNSLLSLVTGATIGSIGKYASENNLGSAGITNLLMEQKDVASSMLPVGLSLASLGLGDWFGIKKEPNTYTETPKETPEYVPPRKNNSNGMNLLKWLIPLALLFLICGYLLKKCNSEENNTPVDTENTVDTTNNDGLTENDTYNNTRLQEDVDLNGTKLKAYQGGLEGQIVNYLNSGDYDKADEATLKDTWYTFDNVNFKMGSSNELEAGSEVQLDNLVAILKAFPAAKIKIGGYTDKVGDAAKNKKLSQDRADFIKDWLNKAGVGSQVSSAEGYGSEFATIPAEASDEERAVDRKMAIRFTK
jgi:outer membrane protein OmpA-like peptidoglycan-associated protein